ncbi:MAG: M20/M25/M40 family metallo-hydrolase, partial [Sinobacteraceae bacterium]|nr:M20/M25/M40 family metallo-hydrolase [Nevskiaceae bacterium]
ENSVVSEHGKPQFFEMDATEKLYGDYRLTAVNPGGHSSQPVPDNAIYELAAALGRLSQFAFPFELNAITRAYYEQMADIEGGQRASDMRAILQTVPDPAAIARLSRDPKDNSILHTTCVATRLDGGHANNALPQRASANINCRILPGHSLEEVREALAKAIADPDIRVQYVDLDGSLRDHAAERRSVSPPPLAPEVMHPLQKVVSSMWPGLRVVPTMSTGATDGVYTSTANIPTYVIGGVQVDRDDVREHGRDERLGINSFERGNEFYYRFLKAVCSN